MKDDDSSNFLKRWTRKGIAPEDSQELRLKKAVLTLIATAIAVLAIFWGSLYVYSGYPLSGAIPLSYAFISFVSIGYFFHTKHFAFFRVSQQLLILLLPFFLMWSLGGFANGSAVMIWGFFAPLAALFFADIRSAYRWLLAFVALVLISGAIDPLVAARVRPMSETINTLYFMMNMGMGFVLIYVVLHYFVKDREEAYARLRANEVKIRELMLTDPLTGVANRRHLDERLVQELNRRARTDAELALMIVDIDHFKRINDTYGHTVGDAVLKTFAATLDKHRRNSDFLARYGGEEFVLLLPHTDREGAEIVARRLHQVIGALYIDDIHCAITASFGVTVVQTGDTAESIMARADQAMYESKAAGRDRITFKIDTAYLTQAS